MTRTWSVIKQADFINVQLIWVNRVMHDLVCYVVIVDYSTVLDFASVSICYFTNQNYEHLQEIFPIQRLWIIGIKSQCLWDGWAMKLWITVNFKKIQVYRHRLYDLCVYLIGIKSQCLWEGWGMKLWITVNLKQIHWVTLTDDIMCVYLLSFCLSGPADLVDEVTGELKLYWWHLLAIVWSR